MPMGKYANDMLRRASRLYACNSFADPFPPGFLHVRKSQNNIAYTWQKSQSTSLTCIWNEINEKRIFILKNDFGSKMR